MADFEAIFELDDIDKIDCIFDINATVYNYEALDKLPQINGETLIGNKTSEELHLASAEDLAGLSSALDFEIQARETADVSINSAITLEIANRQNADIAITNSISELDEKVDGININLTAQIDNLEQDVNDKYNELIRDIDDLTDVVEEDYNTLNTKIDTTTTTINQRITDVADELNQTIEENVVALQQEDTALQNQINVHSQTLTAYDTRITNNTNAITQEIADRQAGDNTLQEQVNDNKNLIDTKQDIINDLSTIRSNAQAGYDIIPQVESNTQRIEDLTVARFPNAIIVGTPHIEGGQVSGFSDSNYLQFPFVDISRGLPFDIYFSFTTSSDVNTQQNILDAYFGIALAIKNGKGIMSLSSNGTSWDIGTSTGTNTLLPNTTYFVKYSWTGTAYSAALSTDDQTYIPDMNLTSSLSPYKTTIFIGGSPNLFGAGSAHPFKGTINFNKSKVVVNGITVWEGMADVGLASRANVSLTNLDEVGENRFNEKQNITDNSLVTLDKTVVGAVNELDAKIKDIQLFKFPDATIIGTPTINNGQVTNFSSNNYLILPFAFDTKDRAFEINMAFTTGSNVSTTQNLLGGNYCLALLIEGGKLVFRASNNGTSWNVADITTTLTLQASTNYFVKIYFDKLSYKISYSTNGEDYTQVGYKVTTETPRHGQVFIGVGNNQHNPFLGIINLNRCNIKLNTSIIWQGMDDAGLATRADISLSNLDELGQAKFDAKQDTLTAGPGIDITNNVISNTQTSAEWGNIQGVLSNQTDLQTALNSKQATISDLETIRAGASKGATAIQNTNDCVHKTGAETVAGVKTFTDTPVITSTALNINNDIASIQKKGVNFLRKNANGTVIISSDGTDKQIILRPNGDTNVTGAVTIASDGNVTATKFSGPLTGDVTGNCSGSSGSCTGNSATATKATQDSAGNQINTTYQRLYYSRYSISTYASSNPYIKLATFTITNTKNYDLSCLFWVEALHAGVSKNYALVKLSARWSGTEYTGTNFEIVEKYGDNTSCFDSLVWAYDYTTASSKGSITGEIWMKTTANNYYTYYFRPTECNEYGDYSMAPVKANTTYWTYYDKSGTSASICFTAITSGYTQVAVADKTNILNNPYSLFDCKFADHLLNNASWLRADTFEWHSGDVYVDAYNKLVEEYATGSEETENGITFKRTSNGFKIALATQETAILNKYNTDGIAWVYILDTANKRFKLPRTKWGFKGLRGQVGDLVDESLPNIKGGLTSRPLASTGAGTITGGSGSFSFTQKTRGTVSTMSITSSTASADGVDFNASRSSSAYQDGAPVQERATQMYLYFYVGETVQNANLIDAGRIAEQLINKVDVDANNFSTTGKELITGWGFPSGRYINLALGASGTTYTAPANGYITCETRIASAGTGVVLRRTSPTFMYARNVASASNQLTACTLPLKKNDTFVFEYGALATASPRNILMFIYAEGAE